MALTATLNLKSQPNLLSVDGEVLVYTEKDEVIVSEASPQGFNPRILILDVMVKRGDGPMKGTTRSFHYEKEVEGRAYDQVTARIQNAENQTADVQVLG